MDKKISELFDYGDGIAVTGAETLFDPGEIKEMTMNKIHQAPRGKARQALRKTSRTLLLAAIIVSLLTVTAVAAGLSIHLTRQQELRDELEITANQVTDYVEYPVPSGNGQGLTLLSTISDGQFQNVFVNVSPISPEEFASYKKGYHGEDTDSVFFFTVDGAEGKGMASPVCDGPQDLDSAYDEESQTLTLLCPVGSYYYENRDRFTLSVQLWNWEEDRFVKDCGSVEVAVTEPQVRQIWFTTPLEIENPDTGEEGRFLGVELMNAGIHWLVEFEGMEQVYGPFTDRREDAVKAHNDYVRSWLRVLNAQEARAWLEFADGSSFGQDETSGWLSSQSAEYEDGLARLSVNFSTVTINPEQVVAVHFGDVRIPVT